MADCTTFMPGFSETRNSLERFITVKTRTLFTSTKINTIGRLSKKMMGEQNGQCPAEEVFSMSSVDPGRINALGCSDASAPVETQTGVDCFGEKIDITTKGGNADDPLCGSSFCGEFAFGVDSYAPTFFSYERRFPTVCIDSATRQPREVKGTLSAIKNDGPKLVLADLDYLMWDLVIARGPGNTAIAERVVFGADVGLGSGEFPYLPQSYLNHEFCKRIQEIVNMDPDNFGKSFTVEASHHQIQKAIEDDQTQKGILRDGARSIEDPFRAEMIQMYDGIRYLSKNMADFVGVIDQGASCTFIRPFNHVHQAGTEYGTVARPNYALMEGANIDCDGRTLPKYEVAQWYVEDSVSYVPFVAKGNVPSSGSEKIKDNVYASPSAFKTYWVADHAVTTPGNCLNDRNQFQQMGQRVVFGLFNRPDKIDHGAILLQPVHRCVTLESNCTDGSAASVATKATSREENYCENAVVCEPCDGSSEASGGETPPTGTGQFVLPFGYSLSRIEEIDDTAVVCITRREGVTGVATLQYTTGDGTAADGTNYTLTAGGLSWADGEGGDKCVTIPLLDNDEVADVAFTLTFATAVGAADLVGGSVVTITITPTP